MANFDSRRVLTPEESALFGGKKALTKKTYTTDENEAKRICGSSSGVRGEDRRGPR
jgi:hypothetical protein